MLLLQRRFRLSRLLDALLGLSDIGGFGRNLFRQSGKLLACLGLLLAGCFELLSNLRQLLSAISLQLRMGCEFVERRAPALLSLLRLGSRLGQLLHQILKLSGALRLLLPPGLKLLLDRGKLRLSLIADLCGFVQPRAGCSDHGLQIGDRPGCLFLLGQLGAQALLIGGERQDLAPSAALVVRFVQLGVDEQPPPEQGEDR